LCLAKRSTDRYQSFTEVEEDLQALRKHLLGARYSATWPDQDHAERDRQTELGLAHLDAGEYSEALACFREAVALDTSRAESWLNVARARLKLWQYQEGLQAAEEGLRRAIRREEFGQLYGVRGQIYTAMMLLPKAMESFDQGLSYTPKSPRLWREKGLLIQRMGLSREAQPCFEKALEYDKLDSLSWRLLGDVLREQERHKKAYDAYAEALKLDPRAAVAWARYGACQLALARPKDAVRSLEAALKLDPDLDEALATLREARQAIK
ncbi:MAG TPA: tetratricopeptide repeat protein, partial [Roseiflexaceae bacterium]|nr:tetratricopeptide repeat protein [Roseiflexaceae bacterium]